MRLAHNRADEDIGVAVAGYEQPDWGYVVKRSRNGRMIAASGGCIVKSVIKCLIGEPHEYL